ncbi:PREDICTED: uncharacterized protein LOC105448464 [Wasmannia auropunctata]|uniref:uncharacterized protein LOC105448464 n=1 Tax=Wasmannia auropunctata TaxID=64793 RepID=UPI0005EE484E|nr:PREDICTED: uncharacterized protein LOC105448464 [Wasmannia auropunctata]
MLQRKMPVECHILCYADDTLVVALGNSMEEASVRVELGVALVVKVILVRGTPVPVDTSLKYLGLTLNRTWSFSEHFARVLPAAERMSLALARLMPNLRGPNEFSRRLYCAVIHSVIFYDAPVWAPTLSSNRRVVRKICAVQRRVALRVIAAYRTVSYQAAFLLARVIPVEFLADRYRRVFLDTREIQGRDIPVTNRMYARIREGALEAALDAWAEACGRPSPTAVELRGALIPVLARWYGRSHGHLTYRMTQMLTGHGCFRSFLLRIGKVPHGNCVFCGDPIDSNVHTLRSCPACNTEREELVGTVDPDLDLRTVICSILESREKKKEDERARQARVIVESDDEGISEDEEDD